MLGLLARMENFIKPKSDKRDPNQKLRDTIYTKVTGNINNPKKEDKIIAKCIELFKKGADPNVLIELEKSLSEQTELKKSPKEKEEYQKYYKDYIDNFLPALKKEVMGLEVELPVFKNEIEQSQGSPTRRAQILEIISGITNKSSDKNHSSSTLQNQKSHRNHQTGRRVNDMGLFKNKSFSGEVATSTSSDMTPQEEDSLAKGVSGKGTPGKYNILRNSSRYDASSPPTLEQSQLNGSFSQSCEDLENKSPSTTADAVEVPRSANTSKLSNDNGSDSGVSSREESLESPINSRRSSVNSTSNSVEEGNNPQKEKTESQVQTKQTAEKEIKIPASATLMTDDDHEKDPVKSEEKKDKKNTTTTVQKSPANKNNSEDTPSKKQPNNRNLHVALVTGCALLAIGCIVAGAITSGLVGAGLFVMAAVFAIAAVAELHSNFLSSKLTSISVEPHVNDKELTACSRL